MVTEKSVEPFRGPIPESGSRHPLLPTPYRVVKRVVETDTVVTLFLEALEGGNLTFRPGQFNMLTAFGVGEIAVSISGDSLDGGPIRHTIASVGAVSHALCSLRVGSLVGVRGPFGNGWDLTGVTGMAGSATQDVVVVAGGVGLAPLRPAVLELLKMKEEGRGRVVVLIGSRSPDQVLFKEELDVWRTRGAHVEVTVDRADASWRGSVGVVTSLISSAPFDPHDAFSLVCGPEVMMRFTARALLDKGMHEDKIQLSLERNMQCGIGWCGHCQLGPYLLCRDGPVFPYGGRLAELLAKREL